MFHHFESFEPGTKRRRFHCNECNQRSIHLVEAAVRGTWDDRENAVHGGTEFYLCRCGGCDNVIFVQEQWDSHGYTQGPDGECEFFVTTKRYPGVMSALIQSKTSDCPQELATIIQEATSSLANNNLLAATILARMSIEEICRDLETSGSNLEKKVDALGQSLSLTKDQLELLHEIRRRGNKGAHESVWMSSDEIKAVFEVIDIIIDQKFAAPARAGRIVRTAKARLSGSGPKIDLD